MEWCEELASLSGTAATMPVSDYRFCASLRVTRSPVSALQATWGFLLAPKAVWNFLPAPKATTTIPGYTRGSRVSSAEENGHGTSEGRLQWEILTNDHNTSRPDTHPSPSLVVNTKVFSQKGQRKVLQFTQEHCDTYEWRASY